MSQYKNIDALNYATNTDHTVNFEIIYKWNLSQLIHHSVTTITCLNYKNHQTVNSNSQSFQETFERNPPK